MNILANSGGGFIRNIAISFALASAIVVYLKLTERFSKKGKPPNRQKGVANKNSSK